MQTFRNSLLQNIFGICLQRELRTIQNFTKNSWEFGIPINTQPYQLINISICIMARTFTRSHD